MVTFSADRGLIHKSQGVNTNLYTVSLLFPLSQHFSVVLSAGEKGLLCPETKKMQQRKEVFAF